MSPASVLRWTLVALMIAVGLYHVARMAAALRRQRRRELDVDATHTLMGLVMAGMLAGSVSGRFADVCFLGFVLATAWFGGLAAQTWVLTGARGLGHPLRQVVGCFAMSYMLVVTSGAGILGLNRPEIRMPGMRMGGGAALSGSGFPLLLILLAATAGVTVWTALTTAGSARRPSAPSPGGVFAPTLTAGCQTAMNATTVYMLAMMV